MDEAAVIYYFADPDYHGDMNAALTDLTERGFRIVKGENADELLFLLQVGRPVAVIYTLATNDSMTSAAFQMVSRRSMDLLVPIIAVGPDDPRDGLTLVYPEGRKPAKRHVAFHSLAELIGQFASGTPSTPSRPPDVIAGKTFGRGKTLLSWKPPPSVVEKAVVAQDAKETPRNRPLVDKLTLEMAAAAAAPAAAEETPVDRPASDVRTLEMASAAAAARGAERASSKVKDTDPEIPTKKVSSIPAEPVRPPLSGPPEPRIIVESSQEIDEPSIGALIREEEAQAESETAKLRKRAAAKPRTWQLIGPLLAIAALVAVGVVIYLATRPAGGPPEPLGPSALGGHQPSPGDGAQPVAPSPRTAPQPPAEATGGTPQPTAEATGGTPQPTAVSPEPEQDRVRPTAGEIAAAAPVAMEELAPGRTVRFPAHFRPGSAVFWYSDPTVEEQLLETIERLSSGHTIYIIGHPTAEEARAKNWSIGLSRAWAVEKYLIRHGIADEAIETERGKPVEPRDDIDERGWLLNRFVDIEIR